MSVIPSRGLSLTEIVKERLTLEDGSLEAETELVEGHQAFRFFSTEIKGDLLILFHRNPGLIDTIDAVARRIGRTSKAIEEDIKDLLAIGILRTRKIGAYEVITFNRSKDDEVQERIVNHLKGIRDRMAVSVTAQKEDQRR
jgi:hypothetical protein